MDLLAELAAAPAPVEGMRLVVLFGSAARGRLARDSDIDVGLLSDGADPRAVRRAVERVARREADLVDLATAPPLLRFEIARTGQVVLEGERDAWVDFKARAMLDWWDEAPVLRITRPAALDLLREAEDLLQHSDALLDRGRTLDLASFYLMLAIQEAIDLAAHWVAAEGWPPPDTAAQGFELLAARAAIPGDLAGPLVGAAGLRNLIAHRYAGVDLERVQREAPAGIEALRRFLVLAGGRAAVPAG